MGTIRIQLPGGKIHVIFIYLEQVIKAQLYIRRECIMFPPQRTSSSSMHKVRVRHCPIIHSNSYTVVCEIFVVKKFS